MRSKIFSTIQLGFLVTTLGACMGVADDGGALAPPTEDRLTPDEAPAIDAMQSFLLTLEDRRPVLTFEVQTPEQRTRTAQKAQVLFRELYVNRQQKLDFYGPEADALPAIDALTERAATLSDAAFQTELRRIFASQRDNHLQFLFAKPMACFSSQLPFVFSDVKDESTGRQVVAVASVDPGFLDFVPKRDGTFESGAALREVQEGDVLLRYDGRPVDDVIAELGSQGSGANESGQRAFGVAMLVFRTHLLVAVPERDRVELTFAHADGRAYSVAMPWISQIDLGCLDAPAPEATPTEGSTALNLYVERYAKWLRAQRTGTTPRGAQLRIAPPAGENETDEFVEHDDSGMFLARRRTTPDGTFALLDLMSFQSIFEIDEALEKMQSVLEQLNDTDGMLIDLRNNPGGIAEIAVAMARFFSPGPLAIGGARLLNTPANEQLIPAMFGADSPFDTALRKARTRAEPMTAPVPVVNIEFVNEHFRHVYTKPVIILTNAFCYSSCDIFAATMQDNGLATVYGVDRFTGAGGATIIDTPFVANLLGAAAPFDSGRPIMRFAHRQFVRGGSHAGELIEDFGVERDREAFVGLSELRQTRDVDALLFRRVLSDLAALTP